MSKLADKVHSEIAAAERRNKIIAAVNSPQFSHGRAGDRLYRGCTLIYHFADTPSGVLLHSVFDSAEADPIIRELQRTSPLSPTER